MPAILRRGKSRRTYNELSSLRPWHVRYRQSGFCNERHPRRETLAEWLFTNQRSFPYSALDPYGPIAERLTGRSLNQDDPDTHRALQRLFEMRNDVAHNAGERADEDQARKCVAAGRRAFAWLDALPPQP